MPPFRLGVDTGGTFCDFVLIDPSTGHARVWKVPTDPQDPSLAIQSGLERLMGGGELSSVATFVHGTTVGTNTLLEGKGARVGLLVTEGFRATYPVRTQSRPHGSAIFDLMYQRPPLLAPLSRTFEIPERVGSQGEVVQPPDLDRARAAVEALARSGVEAVAVCLLFSFLRPEHEGTVAEMVRARLPGAFVSLSSEVLPRIREYPRLSTTVVNAYIGPRMLAYFQGLTHRLDRLDVAPRQRYVMQSNGGAATFAAVSRLPVATVLSGPAAGVVGGRFTGRCAGLDDLITFDMGGTSCDVALIRKGATGFTSEAAVAGQPVAIPMVEIHTVSAGGGTIARVHGGSLRVGPDSAGSHPGPACYGRGGREATVTDAHAVLGYLGNGALLGGTIRPHRELARDVLYERVARPLGVSLERAASGILELVDTRMAEAIRAISTRRGYYLKDFTLVVFGGAGPLHGPRIARQLGIPRVLVPRWPGATSALGLLVADLRRDYLASRLIPLEPDRAGEIASVLQQLERRAREELAGEGFEGEAVRFTYQLGVRYAGHNYELPLPCPPPGDLATAGIEEVRESFYHLHEEYYGHRSNRPAEVLTCYATAWVRTGAPSVPALADAQKGDALSGRRPVFVAEAGGWVETPIWRRLHLAPGTDLTGPAILEQPDSTTFVPPGCRAQVLPTGDLLVETAPVGGHGDAGAG